MAFLLCHEVYSKEASPVSAFVVSNRTSWTVQQSKRPLRAFLLVTLERHFLFESRLDRIRSHLFSGDQTWANVRSIQTRALKRLQSVLWAVWTHSGLTEEAGKLKHYFSRLVRTLERRIGCKKVLGFRYRIRQVSDDGFWNIDQYRTDTRVSDRAVPKQYTSIICLLLPL